jgi:phosphatidylglycerophosphate synthase
MTKTTWVLLGSEFLLATLVTLCSRAVDFCDGRIADEFSREVSEQGAYTGLGRVLQIE